MAASACTCRSSVDSAADVVLLVPQTETETETAKDNSVVTAPSTTTTTTTAPPVPVLAQEDAFSWENAFINSPAHEADFDAYTESDADVDADADGDFEPDATHHSVASPAPDPASDSDSTDADAGPQPQPERFYGTVVDEDGERDADGYPVKFTVTRWVRRPPPERRHASDARDSKMWRSACLERVQALCVFFLSFVSLTLVRSCVCTVADDVACCM